MHSTHNEDTFLQVFLLILKRMLQNYEKILKKCICIVMYVAVSNLQPQNSASTVAKVLKTRFLCYVTPIAKRHVLTFTSLNMLQVSHVYTSSVTRNTSGRSYTCRGSENYASSSINMKILI